MDLITAKMMTYNRKMALNAGYSDPFVAGENATKHDLEKAKKIAQILEECIEKSENDLKKFRKLLNEYIKED